MSFGFGVGDFIVIVELPNKIQKDFADAPIQFKAISDEYVILSRWLSRANCMIRIGFEASTSSSKISMTSYRDYSLTA